MRTYVWQYERGWGVFCCEDDSLVAWHEFHNDALNYSELIASWQGPPLCGVCNPK